MSFWAGITLKRSVVLVADSRRVYPGTGGFEDGQSNLIRINEQTWLAAAGSFPVAGVMAGRTVEAFRQVFAEGKVDLTLLVESEGVLRDILGQMYGQIKGEGSPSVDLLLAGISSEEEPYLAPLGSSAGFRLKLVREPFATVCLNFPEPLQSEVRSSLAPLRTRLLREPLEERRAKLTTAALRQLLGQVAAATEWVAPEGEVVVISPKGAALSRLKAGG